MTYMLGSPYLRSLPIVTSQTALCLMRRGSARRSVQVTPTESLHFRGPVTFNDDAGYQWLGTLFE